MSLTVPQKEILLKKIEELSALIKSSEEIQKTYDKLLRQGKTGDIGFDPIDIKEKIYNFQMGYRELKHELDNLQRIILVGTPYISERPVKPKLKMNVALAAIFGVFGGIFAAFLLEHIENIRSGRRD